MMRGRSFFPNGDRKQKTEGGAIKGKKGTKGRTGRGKKKIPRSLQDDYPTREKLLKKIRANEVPRNLKKGKDKGKKSNLKKGGGKKERGKNGGRHYK